MRRADASQAAMTAGIDTLFQPEPDLINCFSAIDPSGRPTIVAAVSGGGDSLALLLLAKLWLETTANGTRLVAATVDHGLRPESAGEARDVAALCARFRIPHHILPWRGAKPEHGVSAAARDMRYRLLAEAARAFGAGIVLTGHTLDDQVETVAMRRQRRGEGRGLAGMAPATLFEGGVWIVRPLLGARREALRAFLRRNGIGWADDPSNTDPYYERARVRAALSGDAPAEILPAIDAARRHRLALAERAAGLIRTHARLAAPGLVRLAPGFAAVDDAEAAIHALRLLLAACGGSTHLPDEARAATLFGRLGAGGVRATLSRSVVDCRRSGTYLRRESRGLPAAAPVEDGALWDGRFRLHATGGAGDLAIAPCGAEAARLAPAVDGVPQSLVRAAFAAEPVLWAGQACLGPARAAAAGSGAHAVPVTAPWATFLPAFDLTAARALAELLGCEAPPALPLVGHNGG